jgi:phosphoribosyl-ATP pyrophosphohydrolase
MKRIEEEKTDMFRKYLYIVVVFTLLLAACGARSASAPPGSYSADEGWVEVEQEKAAYAPEPEASIGGEGDRGTANLADSTAGTETIERMVIKNADLSIVVDDPEKSMDAIAEMAEEMGGFVVTSNLYQTTLSGGLKVPHASITIRVPAESLDEALAKIKEDAGEILSENVSGQDVTREYTDLQSRLRNLESAEAQLMEIMDEAKGTEEVLEVYNNLVSVREQIEVIKGQMQYYEQAAALSMISVELTADEAIQPLQIGGWQPVGTAKDAIETLIKTLQLVADAAIWVVLCVLPIGIVVGIPLWLAIRAGLRIRKRRKEATGMEVVEPVEEQEQDT